MSTKTRHLLSSNARGTMYASSSSLTDLVREGKLTITNAIAAGFIRGYQFHKAETAKRLRVRGLADSADSPNRD